MNNWETSLFQQLASFYAWLCNVLAAVTLCSQEKISNTSLDFASPLQLPLVCENLKKTVLLQKYKALILLS